MRQRIEVLNRIEELDQERATHRRLRLTNGYVRRCAQGDHHLAELKRHRIELDEKRLDLSRAELRRDDLLEQPQIRPPGADRRPGGPAHRRHRRPRENSARRDRHRAGGGDWPPAPKGQLAETWRRSELPQMRYGRYCTRMTGSTRVAGLLCRAPGRDRNADLLATHLLGLMPTCRPTSRPSATNYAEQQALLKEQVDQLRQEAERLQREINQLRTGDRDVSYETEAPQAARLRRLLRAELGLAADEVPYLCTLLRVPDESWQDAVEGMLGRSRFDLLVPPEHYDAAMRLYRRRRHKDGLHGVGLLDAERLVANARAARPAAWRPKSRPTTPPPAALSICCWAAMSNATHWRSCATIALPSPAIVLCGATTPAAT